jgi:RNA polymerase sigma factor (sigma-70 family)
MKHSTERQREAYARCMAAVEECNAVSRWEIDAVERQRYAAAMTTFLADDATDDQLHDIAANYHADHVMVAALRDQDARSHDHLWEQWMRQVMLVLRRAGLAWSSDGAIDSDDLAQIARAELVRALPSYRYQSRFTIWASRVVVQSVRRHLRDSQRTKRAVRPESLDQIAETDPPPDPFNAAESSAHARVLYDMIMTILAEQPDQRWRYLFHLAAVEDLRVAEIGALVQLSQPRVRALLQQIRQLLQQHPAIEAWQAAEVALAPAVAMIGKAIAVNDTAT